MHKEPRQPGDETLQPQSPYLGYSGFTPNDCHIALIAVPERRRWASKEAIAYDTRHIGALLNCNGRHPRQRRISLMCIVRHIANNKQVRISWYGKVGIDYQASALIGRERSPLGKAFG